MLKCHRCGLPIASDVEETALAKLKRLDPERYHVLIQRRCHCRPGYTSAFTSRPQPPDLQAHDKWDR